jgi:hypothetical protein
MSCNGMFAIIFPCLDTEIPVATNGFTELKEIISTSISITPNPANISEKIEQNSSQDLIDSVCFIIGPT